MLDYLKNAYDSLGKDEQSLILGVCASLLAMFIGYITVRLIKAIISTMELKRKTGFSIFKKEWLCEWEPETLNKPDWVKERLLIRRTIGKLKIRNKSNDNGYNYVAEARLAKGERLDGKYLVGTWFDTNEAATAAGVFMLTIEHRGNYIYGYIVGPNDEGPIKYGKYVIGRTQDDLETAKRMLESHA